MKMHNNYTRFSEKTKWKKLMFYSAPVANEPKVVIGVVSR